MIAELTSRAYVNICVNAVANQQQQGEEGEEQQAGEDFEYRLPASELSSNNELSFKIDIQLYSIPNMF